MPKTQTDGAATAAPPDVAEQQAYLLLARRLRQVEQQVLGLWPITADIDFDDVVVSLGRALVALGDTVGVLGPREHWLEDLPRFEVKATAIAEGLHRLTPGWPRTPSLGDGIEQILPLTRRYSRVLVDLTGLGVASAPEVALLPDIAMVIVATSGRVTKNALAKISRCLPSDRLAGVVLADVVARAAEAIG